MRGRAIALGVLLASLIVLAPIASASVISGTLDIEGLGVVVSANKIDWLPAGGGSGTFSTTVISNLTYDAGIPLGVVNDGSILDLVAPTVFPVAGFFTFPSAPGLVFDLTKLGPGSSNFNCAALTNGGSCSVFPGSPFILTKIGGTTAVSLEAFGTATDSLNDKAWWSGLFTANLSNISPGTIQANFLSNPNYSIRSSYSGNFQMIPESSTSLMALAGLGLLVLGRIRRRKV